MRKFYFLPFIVVTYKDLILDVVCLENVVLTLLHFHLTDISVRSTI